VKTRLRATLLEAEAKGNPHREIAVLQGIGAKHVVTRPFEARHIKKAAFGHAEADLATVQFANWSRQWLPHQIAAFDKDATAPRKSSCVGTPGGAGLDDGLHSVRVSYRLNPPC